MRIGLASARWGDDVMCVRRWRRCRRWRPLERSQPWGNYEGAFYLQCWSPQSRPAVNMQQAAQALRRTSFMRNPVSWLTWADFDWISTARGVALPLWSSIRDMKTGRPRGQRCSQKSQSGRAPAAMTVPGQALAILAPCRARACA